MNTGFLTPDDSLLLVVDVQARLAGHMHQLERLMSNLRIMIQGARVLGLPLLCTEQYPEGLGPTVPEVAELLPDVRPIHKRAFSCCGSDEFIRRLEAEKRNRVLIVGIEAHVCVYQTTADLVRRGYEVHVVADAVSSRTPDNRDIGLRKMERAGAELTGTETALFELLGMAEGPRFKEILALVK